MARSRRVRQLTTDDLASELASILLDAMQADEVTEAQQARFSRVARELARRDYRFRPHGKDCTCADCWMLWDTWQDTLRRADPQFTHLEAQLD